MIVVVVVVLMAVVVAAVAVEEAARMTWMSSALFGCGRIAASLHRDDVTCARGLALAKPATSQRYALSGHRVLAGSGSLTVRRAALATARLAQIGIGMPPCACPKVTLFACARGAIPADHISLGCALTLPIVGLDSCSLPIEYPSACFVCSPSA